MHNRIVKLWLALIPVILVHTLSAQTILFTFDNIPAHSPLPVSTTGSGITAYLTSTGQGYSIQAANTLGFTPAGFSGNVIYPSSVYLADLLIKFDQSITDFSIMYACQELACDDAATMKVSAYFHGIYAGSNTRTATFPGTWPVDTLSCSFPGGFDSVVIHYASPPPTCKDYGVIFIADNMQIIPMIGSGIKEAGRSSAFSLFQNYPNPFNPATSIDFVMTATENVEISIYNALGQKIASLLDREMSVGKHSVEWEARNFSTGVYLYELKTRSYSERKKMILQK